MTDNRRVPSDPMSVWFDRAKLAEEKLATRDAEVANEELRTRSIDVRFRIATLRGKSEAMESVAGFVHELCMRDDQSAAGIRVCRAIIRHIADLHTHLTEQMRAALAQPKEPI